MIQQTELNILLYWIMEREKIRKAKESGAPKPWTQDPHLQSRRFCNVRRMDDKVSQELLHRWYWLCPPDEQLVAATLARLVNWPESLAEISATDSGFRLVDLCLAREILHQRSARGDKVFTGAYIVPGVPGKSKVDSVMDVVEKVAAWAAYVVENTMQETWLNLMRYESVGPFIAGQIVADLAQLSIGEDWPDRELWAPLGPGSMRGMNRLHGRPKNYRFNQPQFEEQLTELIDKLTVRGFMLSYRLLAMDVQNCLCEFDKYRRLQLCEGTTRSTYPGAV